MVYTTVGENQPMVLKHVLLQLTYTNTIGRKQIPLPLPALSSEQCINLELPDQNLSTVCAEVQPSPPSTECVLIFLMITRHGLTRIFYILLLQYNKRSE